MTRPSKDGAVVPADRGRGLAEIILAGQLRAGAKPGSRLPTERQLAADLGMTRTSVRHALAVLEADGRISREVGRGTFLRETQGSLGGDGAAAATQARPARAGPPPGSDQDRPGDGAAGYAPADVMTIRRLLEPPAMRLVVAWARASDFREMDRCLAGATQATRHDEFELWDLALHRAIMGASHSPLLIRLYAVVDDARHGQFWGDLKRRTTSPQRQQEYQADHRQLVDALRARDAERAVEAMRAHLNRITSTLFDGAS